jgi:hypothetical protein
MGANQQIIGFLSGESPDSEGRYLSEIQKWSDSRLESAHDFIQWMFPLIEPSRVNQDAPLLDRETIAEIRSRPELLDAVRASFRCMQNFYERSLHWVTPGNHNHLRITRILTCLALLGLKTEAVEFFHFLERVYKQEQRRTPPGITHRSYDLWKRAVYSS